jgi:hypothetical protein
MIERREGRNSRLTIVRERTLQQAEEADKSFASTEEADMNTAPQSGRY